MMYYKIINDRQVLSTCKSIRTANGVISKPTAEQIAAEGWLPYTPPYVPEVTPALSEVMEAVKKILSTETSELSDEDALNVAALYPTWSSLLGESVTAGTRVWDDGKLWKVIQPHTFQANWRPADTPALFVEVSIEEWPKIPENIPSTAPWMAGDKGTWQGQHYICKQNNCTWNPDQYPAAWELVP